MMASHAGRLAALIVSLLWLATSDSPCARAAPSSRTRTGAATAELQRQQTRYYRAQADELELQHADFFAMHAAMLSALGPGAALLAVVASLLALLQNASASRRAQRDAMFGDALKRFGEVASVPARASAAIALGQLAVRYPQWGIESTDPATAPDAADEPRLNQSDYYAACLAQLSLGLQLERDESVVVAIGKALALVSSAQTREFADEIDTIRLVTLQELIRVTVTFVTNVVLWFNAHPNIDAVSEYEREVYLPLINHAMNFEQHRPSAVGFLSGWDVTEVQRVAFDHDVIDWREAQSGVGGPVRPRTLSHADIAKLAKRSGCS